MKLLAVFFLAGLALAYAVPAPRTELSLKDVEELDEFLGTISEGIEQRSFKDDLRDRLREAYDQILERIREAVESGKTVSNRFLDKLRDIRGRLKGDSSEMDDKARGLLEKFTGKARDAWQNILERLGIQKRSVERKSIKDDIRNRLREAYDQVLERIREAVENGKKPRDSFLDKLRDIRGRLKGDSSELDDKARGLLDRFTGKARDTWQSILDRLGIQKRSVESEFEQRSIKDDIRNRLREAYDQVLERIREAVENGKKPRDSFLDKLRDIRGRLKGDSSELDDKARGLLDRFTGKARDTWQSILDRLGIQKRSVESEFEQRSIKDDIRNRLREAYDQVLERIREAVENGKKPRDSFLDKLRDIRGRLKGDSSELDDKARGLLDRFTGKARDTWQSILDRLGVQKRSVESEFEQRSIKDDIRNRLREAYDQVLERIREAVENGKKPRDSFLDKLRDIRGRLKGDSSELDDKARGLLDRFTGKARDTWQSILDRLGIQKRSVESELEQRSIKDDIRNRLREAYDQVLERIREAVENGKKPRDSFLDKLRDIRGRLKGDSSELDDKARGLLDRFTDKARDTWQSILDRLGIQKRSVDSQLEQRSIKDDIRNRLREAYDQVLERIREAVENGKKPRDSFLDKLRDIRGRLKGDSSELDDKARGLLDRFTGKARDTWQSILDRLGIQQRSVVPDDEEEGEKSDLVRRLREKFEKVVQRIKDALEKGNKFDNAVEKLRKITQKLKDLRADLSEKGKELVKSLREKVKEYFQRIVQKVSEKRAVDFKDLLRRLREKIRNTFDADAIKAKIEELFGKGNDISEQLLQKLKERGGQWKEKILGLIDRLVGDREEDKRSVKEVFEQVRDYLREVRIELKEKFSKFGQWAKDKYERGLEKGKDRVENLRKLAREFINDTKLYSKDVAVQAKEFFREYKEDLGKIYEEVKEKVREIVERH